MLIFVLQDNEDHDSGTESDDEIETSVEMPPGSGSTTSGEYSRQLHVHATYYKIISPSLVKVSS